MRKNIITAPRLFCAALFCIFVAVATAQPASSHGQGDVQKAESQLNEDQGKLERKGANPPLISKPTIDLQANAEPTKAELKEHKTEKEKYSSIIWLREAPAFIAILALIAAGFQIHLFRVQLGVMRREIALAAAVAERASAGERPYLFFRMPKDFGGWVNRWRSEETSDLKGSVILKNYGRSPAVVVGMDLMLKRSADPVDGYRPPSKPNLSEISRQLGTTVVGPGEEITLAFERPLAPAFTVTNGRPGDIALERDGRKLWVFCTVQYEDITHQRFETNFTNSVSVPDGALTPHQNPAYNRRT